MGDVYLFVVVYNVIVIIGTDLSNDLLDVIKWMIHPQPQLRCVCSIQCFTIIY